MNTLKRFMKDERGLELSEYAIMAGLIIVVAVGTILTMGGYINSIFEKVRDALGDADTAATST